MNPKPPTVAAMIVRAAMIPTKYIDFITITRRGRYINRYIKRLNWYTYWLRSAKESRELARLNSLTWIGYNDSWWIIAILKKTKRHLHQYHVLIVNPSSKIMQSSQST